MPALSKFLVLLALVLLAGHANAFISLSSVAGKQVRINHLTHVPSCKPTSDQIYDQSTNQRLEWDAELPNILSPKRGKYGLSQKQDAELPSKIAISITQNSNITSYTLRQSMA